MFIPKSFEITDVGVLHDLIRTDSFGILVGTHDDAPYASHIPFVLDPDKGPNGTLFAHVARNNPQAGMFDQQQELLAIFQGPHGYVSPRWYNPGNAVPTWNYAVVHAYGRPQVITDPAEVRRQQELLVAAHEGAEGWTMDGQSDDYIEGMLRGIIAFEMPITRIEGKFKLSQNRSHADQIAVVDHLRRSERPGDIALANLMELHLSKA